MRRIKILVLAMVAMVLLSGCFKFDMSLEVNADDTVDGTWIFAVDEEVYELMKEDDDSAFFDEGDDELPEGAKIEEYSEDGKVGQKITFTGVSFEELSTIFDDEGEEFTLVKNADDTYEFNGILDMSEDAGEDDLGFDDDSGFGDDEFELGEDFESEMEDMMALMFRDAEFKVSVTFPGKIIESNGDVDGRTVTWDIDLTEESTTTMNAKAEEASGVAKVAESIPGGEVGGVPLLAIIGGGLLLLIVAVGGFFLLRRKPTEQA